jgi:hypothetical protein
MLVAIKDEQAKDFMWRHSRTCFELLDADSSKAVSEDEFATFGSLFKYVLKRHATSFCVVFVVVLLLFKYVVQM